MPLIHIDQAPELLLYDDAPQTKEVDVYAFGMVRLQPLMLVTLLADEIPQTVLV